MKGTSLFRALLLCALVAGFAATAHAQGKLEIVGGDTYDWGTVAPGKLTTVITLKNAGNGELKINDIRPGCGCTVATPIDKNLLGPGEIGKFSLSLDVSTRSGPVEKVVTINTSDSAGGAHILHLKANIKRALTFTPMLYMIVSDAKKDVESPASPMKIKNTSDAPITISLPVAVPGGNIKVRFDSKGFDSKGNMVLKPGDEYDLKAFVTPNDGTSLYGTVKMQTTSTEMPTADISISGTMAQPTSQSATQAPK